MPGGVLGSVNDLLFGGQPKIPDFTGAANAQTAANRPDQTTPYGTSQWTQDPVTGKWSQKTSFTGPLAGAADSLMTRWGQNAAAGYGTGDDARRQAQQAAWSQFSSMMDPIMAQRENKSRSDLLNMGLDPGSTGYNTGYGNVTSANDKLRLEGMDQSVEAGNRAQAQTFAQNRQSWLDPLSALGQMQGLLQMPGVPGAGNYLGAAEAQYGANQGQYGQTMSNITGLLQGAGSVAGMLGGMPSIPGLGSTGGYMPPGGPSPGNPYSPGGLTPPNFNYGG